MVAQQVQESCEGACGLSKEARDEMGHIAGVLKDMGGGDYSKGAEYFRKALNVFGRIDKFSILTVRTIYIIILIGVIGAGAKIFGVGFFEFFRN